MGKEGDRDINEGEGRGGGGTWKEMKDRGERKRLEGGGRKCLTTATLTVLGAFDDSWKIEKLNLRSLGNGYFQKLNEEEQERE